MDQLFFATSNLYKFSEFQRLFAFHGLSLEHADIELQEVQSLDLELIARDKVVKAYSTLSRPVFVDASGLAMRALKGLPAGLNRPFWDVLKDEVCGLAARLGDDQAEMMVQLAFCDGKRIYSVAQRDPGRIATSPAPVGSFHLDRVFIPDGCSLTLAEMTTAERDRVSHRAKAVVTAINRLRSIDLGKSLGLR